MELVLAEWKEIAIMGILAVSLSILIAKVFLLIVNIIEKIIVPELELGRDKWKLKFERYLKEYNLEIDSYSYYFKKEPSSLLLPVDYVKVVTHDINHYQGSSLFTRLLNLNKDFSPRLICSQPKRRKICKNSIKDAINHFITTSRRTLHL